MSYDFSKTITHKGYQTLGVNSILDLLCEIEVDNYFYLVFLMPLYYSLLNLKLNMSTPRLMLYVCTYLLKQIYKENHWSSLHKVSCMNPNVQ